MYVSMLSIRDKVEGMTGDTGILLLNREHMIKDQQILALESISHAPLKDYLREMLRAALLSERTKHRLKWFACACAAPFLPRQRLKMLVTSSVTRPWVRSL
jgi:hypothetical protein